MMTNVFPKMVGLPGMLKSLLGVFAFSCLPVAKAGAQSIEDITPVSYTHLRAHETS